MTTVLFQIVSASDGEAISSKVYASAKEAQSARPMMEIELGIKLRIAKIDAGDAWRMREASRISDGTYKPLPQWWRDATWWLSNPIPLADHYAHISGGDASMIAFTESAEKGARDIQTRISASRYLAKFFSNLRPEEISAISARFNAREYELEIGHTPEAFEEAYEGQAVCAESCNYESCMQHNREFFYTVRHPAYAYGAGDLSIAFFRHPEEATKIMARAVIWPKHKTFVRLYGREESDKVALRVALEAEGYRRTNHFEGARMLKIECRNERLLMPYIDGDVQTLDEDGGYLVISSDGDIDGEVTEGKTEYGSASRYSCEHCGDRMSEGEANYVQGNHWCESCYESESFYCDYYEESFNSNRTSSETVIVRGMRKQTWSRRAARNYAFECEHTSAYYANSDFTAQDVITANGTEMWCLEACEGEYFEDTHGDFYASEDFTAIEVVTDASGTVEVWCKETTEGNYFTCEACGQNFANALSGENGMCEGCTKQGATPIGKVDDDAQMEIAL